MRRVSRTAAFGAALAVAALGPACGEPTGPRAGTLAVTLATPNAGQDGAILFTVTGPAALTASAAPAGLRVFHESFGTTSTTFIVTGTLDGGTILRIGVEDLRAVGQYAVVIQQVSAADYALRPLTGYSLTVAR